MKITIISVGKRSGGAEQTLIDEYTKRLRALDVSWHFLAHAAGDAKRAKAQESAAILAALQPSDFVVLLDERGRPLNNQQLVQLCQNSSKRVVFVIGGAYGVDQSVRSRADATYRISDLILPHKLVRILLAEQLYRSEAIIKNHPYHHE